MRSKAFRFAHAAHLSWQLQLGQRAITSTRMRLHISRTFGLLLFSMPVFSASMIPWARSDRMPSPFTTPAMPYAPPRLVQTEQLTQNVWQTPDMCHLSKAGVIEAVTCRALCMICADSDRAANAADPPVAVAVRRQHAQQALHQGGNVLCVCREAAHERRQAA